MNEIQDFIYEKEGRQREILQFLHDFVISQAQITCKIRYKVPFYYRKTWFCYLNPKENEAVEICFIRANELSNSSGILDFKNRKQVAGITIHNVNEIQIENLAVVIQEAILLDETIPYKRSF